MEGRGERGIIRNQEGSYDNAGQHTNTVRVFEKKFVQADERWTGRIEEDSTHFPPMMTATMEPAWSMGPSLPMAIPLLTPKAEAST